MSAPENQDVPLDSKVKSLMEFEDPNRKNWDDPFNIWFSLMIVSVLVHPVVTLMLFLGVEYNLQQNFETYGRGDLTKVETFAIHEVIIHPIYYGQFVLYVFILIIFWRTSWFYAKNFKEFVVQYILLDNMWVCTAAVSIVYIFAHNITYCYRFDSVNQTGQNLKFSIVAQYQLKWADVIIFILYLLSNISIVGMFRLQMLYAQWSGVQTFIYKAAFFFQAIFFVSVGVFIISQSDKFNKFKESFNELGYADIYDEYAKLPSQQPDFLLTWVIYKTIDGYKSFSDKIANFIILFVFTHFNFVFEIFCKISDFDRTAELSSDFILKELQNQEDDENSSKKSKSEKSKKSIELQNN